MEYKACWLLSCGTIPPGQMAKLERRLALASPRPGVVYFPTERGLAPWIPYLPAPSAGRGYAGRQGGTPAPAVTALISPGRAM